MLHHRSIRATNHRPANHPTRLRSTHGKPKEPAQKAVAVPLTAKEALQIAPLLVSQVNAG
jgi:hypothetical protein